MIILFTTHLDFEKACQLLIDDGQEFHAYNAEFRIIAPKLSSTLLFESNGISKFVAKQIQTPYQLSSLEFKKNTSVNVNGVRFSKNDFQVIAGPCSVEDEDQMFEVAEFLKLQGLKFIRGGAYKPRSSPYSFKGLGLEGLKLIHRVAKNNGLAVVTELMDLSLLDEVYEYADIIQIGSRNMSNFYLLNELGKINKPVLLKRGMQARTVEWLLAADYILSGGNESVILCERGIRSFDPSMRNVMDLNVIPLLHQLSHLPVIADPSHGTGDASLVPALTLASVAAGANGIMLEIHPNPEKAKSDSKQALTLQAFAQLLPKVYTMRDALAVPLVNN